MSDGVPCMWMRGGTSKGGFFLKDDLPSDTAARDALLLRIMGSPDPRQIDGMGGGDPLTSKVAVVSKSAREGIDIDYLFLQVAVDRGIVSDAQNCGNILAGVGPFAIERGLLTPSSAETSVTIFMENTGQVAEVALQTPEAAITYEGNTRIDGVPGSHAPVAISFRDTAGSSCRDLQPTGNPVDVINSVPCTLIDNGMPCIVIRAQDVGLTGYESKEELESEASQDVRSRIEAIRLAAGPQMNLGDVSEKSVPKIMLVAPPREGGAICVRSFIPHRAHASIGVLGAVTVATACLLENSVASGLAIVPEGAMKSLGIEHPSGQIECRLAVDASGHIVSSGIVRTARKLMDGVVFAA